MPRKPDVLCAGPCGRLIHSGRGCLPPGQATCRECRRAAGMSHSVSPKRRSPGTPPPACSKSGCIKLSRTRGLCKNHYHQQFPTPSDLTHARKHNQMKNHQRRGRTRAPDAEMIDRDAIGERDGWRCGICRRRVDRTKCYPDPRSPSLDHVIPQSEGGPHTHANVRISHLSCNVARSNLGGGEQLALIG